MTVNVAVVEVLPTVTTTIWSPLGSAGINTSVVNSPDASVAIGNGGSTEMPPRVKDAIVVKGGNPVPVMVTHSPGSADCGSTLMDAGISETIVIGILAEVPAITISTWAFPNPNLGTII